MPLSHTSAASAGRAVSVKELERRLPQCGLCAAQVVSATGEHSRPTCGAPRSPLFNRCRPPPYHSKPGNDSLRPTDSASSMIYAALRSSALPSSPLLASLVPFFVLFSSLPNFRDCPILNRHGPVPTADCQHPAVLLACCACCPRSFCCWCCCLCCYLCCFLSSCWSCCGS